MSISTTSASLCLSRLTPRRNSTSPVPNSSRRRSLAEQGESLDGEPDGLGEPMPEAVIDTGGKARALVRGDLVEIEHVLLAPVAHHFITRKNVDLIKIRDPVQRGQIPLEID